MHIQITRDYQIQYEIYLFGRSMTEEHKKDNMGYTVAKKLLRSELQKKSQFNNTIFLHTSRKSQTIHFIRSSKWPVIMTQKLCPKIPRGCLNSQILFLIIFMMVSFHKVSPKVSTFGICEKILQMLLVIMAISFVMMSVSEAKISIKQSTKLKS